MSREVGFLETWVPVQSKGGCNVCGCSDHVQRHQTLCHSLEDAQLHNVTLAWEVGRGVKVQSCSVL